MSQYVYGKNTVYSLIKNNKEIEVLYIQTGRRDDEIRVLAEKKGIRVQLSERKALDTMVDGNHQGYIAKIPEYRTYELDELIHHDPDHPGLLIALDSLEDPHNLGAILRTAACVGADGVIIEKNRSVSLNGTVAKVSVGAIDKVKVAKVTNLAQSLKELKEQGYWIVGTDMNQPDYRSVDYNMPIVLVIGSEGKGMRRLIRESCDLCVSLPMESEMNSLNASVAAGIFLYQIYASRHPLK